MHIAIDARFYRSETGGIGRYTRGLLSELAKLDAENQYTIFITPQDKSEYNIKATNFKLEVIGILHYSISEQTKFLRILNRGNFDLVHFLNFNHPIFYKRPFITTIHDLTMLLYPAGKGQKSLFKRIAFKKVMKSAVKNSQKIIAVSQATKNDCIKILGATPKKIEVIYEAVDSNYSKPKKLMKLWKLKSYLLFVSQWRPHKGLPELIKAFEILKSKYKIPHQLVITGKPNPDFPEITYNIQHSTFNKDIITPGFVADPDLQILYQNASAFVFPSFYEGFGLGPLEAMACGCPVVSSNLSCMPEILGDAAQYFNPNNINKMAETIYKVLIDKKLRGRMSQAGLKQVQKYSWQKMAKETLAIYKNLEIK